MNKIKVVALAILVSVFSGNVYALMSIKRSNQIAAASGIVTGAASAAGFYYFETTRRGGFVGEVDISLKDKMLFRTKRIKEDHAEWLKSRKRVFAVLGGLGGLGPLVGFSIVGLEIGAITGLCTRVFLDRFTVVGLIDRVDDEIKKAESVVLNPKGHLLAAGYFSRTIGSLKRCYGEIVDYLENSPVEQTIEDGYLDRVVDKKAQVEELLSKLVELENRHNEAMAAEKKAVQQ